MKQGRGRKGEWGKSEGSVGEESCLLYLRMGRKPSYESERLIQGGKKKRIGLDGCRSFLVVEYIVVDLWSTYYSAYYNVLHRVVRSGACTVVHLAVRGCRTWRTPGRGPRCVRNNQFLCACSRGSRHSNCSFRSKRIHAYEHVRACIHIGIECRHAQNTAMLEKEVPAPVRTCATHTNQMQTHARAHAPKVYFYKP